MISIDPRMNKLLMSWLFSAFMPSKDEPTQEQKEKQFCLGIDTGQAIMTDCERMGIAGNCGTDSDCSVCQYNKEQL